MDNIYLTIFFISGIIMGSFYNVVGKRLPKNESLIFPASHCVKCKHLLKWYELIPIISYLIQLGRCRHCKEKIALGYLIIEVITGTLFALLYNEYGFSVELMVGIVFVSALLISIISDIEYMVILDEVLFVGAILILLIELFGYGFNTAAMHVINGVISFTIMYLIKIFGDAIFRKESLGGGDIKLMFLFGITVGWKLSLLTIFFGTFIAFPVALYVLYKRKDNMIPFGPFLSVAAILVMVVNIDVDKVISIIFR